MDFEIPHEIRDMLRELDAFVGRRPKGAPAIETGRSAAAD